MKGDALRVMSGWLAPKISHAIDLPVSLVIGWQRLHIYSRSLHKDL